MKQTVSMEISNVFYSIWVIVMLSKQWQKNILTVATYLSNLDYIVLLLLSYFLSFFFATKKQFLNYSKIDWNFFLGIDAYWKSFNNIWAVTVHRKKQAKKFMLTLLFSLTEWKKCFLFLDQEKVLLPFLSGKCPSYCPGHNCVQSLYSEELPVVYNFILI